MAQPSKSAAKKFICSCQNDTLSKHQIIDHLKLKAAHHIKKIVTQSSKDFQNSILKKIENIEKTQIQIQASSNQLIHNITENTLVIMQKLSNFIHLLRHLLLNPLKVNQEKNFELINTFKANLPLYTALTQHFEQQPLAQSTIEAIARNVKIQVMNIRRNYIGGMKCMAVFSDEKRVVTGGDDGAIRMWDLKTKSQIWFILKHKNYVKSLALAHAEDLVLTGSEDTTVRLWNVKLKFHVHKFVGHTLPVSSVLFSQDQSTGFSGSYDKTIIIWDLKLLTIQRAITFKDTIYAICFIREERIIVACSGVGYVSFFSINNSKHSKTLSHHNSTLACICFTPNEEQFITGSIDGTVEIWDTNSLKRSFFQKKHSITINSILISTCSKLFATGSDDGILYIWDFIKLHTIKLIQNQSSVSSLYFVKSSNSILICCAFSINWCSLSLFEIEEKIKTKPSVSMAISPDLKYVVYGIFRVCLIDIENKKKVEKSSYTKKNIISLKFSPNGAFVAAGCNEGEIIILFIPNLVHFLTLNTNLSRINFLSFSKSNEMIGFSDNSTSVKVMSIKTKEILYKNEKYVNSVCFCSNDEKFIYSDGLSIRVLSKNFSLLTKIRFSFFINKLFVNEDQSYILVNHLSTRWSILKVESLEKILEDKSRKYLKEWCTSRHDIKFENFLISHQIKF